MSPDPLQDLVQGIVAERKAREARLAALADRVLGRSPAAPAPEPEAAPPPAPVPEPEPPPPATVAPPALPGPPLQEDAPARSGEWFHRQVSELKDQREDLLRKNTELFEEVERLRNRAEPKGGDDQREMYERLVADLRAALSREQAALEAERAKSQHLEGLVEELRRERGQPEAPPARPSGIQDSRKAWLEAIVQELKRKP